MSEDAGDLLRGLGEDAGESWAFLVMGNLFTLIFRSLREAMKIVR